MAAVFTDASSNIQAITRPWKLFFQVSIAELLFFDPRLAYLTWLRVQRPRSEFFLLVEWQKATSFHLWKMPTPNSIVPNFTFSCWSIVQKLWEQNARWVKNPGKENQSRIAADKSKSHVNCGYRLVFLFQFLYQIYLVVNIMQIHYL